MKEILGFGDESEDNKSILEGIDNIETDNEEMQDYERMKSQGYLKNDRDFKNLGGNINVRRKKMKNMSIQTDFKMSELISGNGKNIPDSEDIYQNNGDYGDQNQKYGISHQNSNGISGLRRDSKGNIIEKESQDYPQRDKNKHLQRNQQTSTDQTDIIGAVNGEISPNQLISQSNKQDFDLKKRKKHKIKIEEFKTKGKKIQKNSIENR